MKEVSSFIDQVVTNKTSTHGRNGKIAQLVQCVPKELIANRIAVTWNSLSHERQARKLDAVRSGVPAQEMVEKPEHILSFIQQTMNACCWAARTVIKSGKQTDLANGLDFSQSVAEQEGQFASASIKDVESTLMQDFAILNELHSWLSSKMNYLTDLDPLFLFSEKQKIEPDLWEHVHMLMDINDVLAVLDEKALELAAQGDANISEYASTHTFGAPAINAAKKLKKAA